EQAVLIPRQAEEPVLLRGPHHLARRMDRAARRTFVLLQQLVIALERLAADAVVALVAAAIEITRGLDAADHLGDRRVVPLLCGADEVVVADREPVPRALELSGDAVDPLLRRHACGLGTLEHLQPVL